MERIMIKKAQILSSRFLEKNTSNIGTYQNKTKKNNAEFQEEIKPYGNSEEE